MMKAAQPCHYPRTQMSPLPLTTDIDKTIADNNTNKILH